MIKAIFVPILIRMRFYRFYLSLLTDTWFFAVLYTRHIVNCGLIFRMAITVITIAVANNMFRLIRLTASGISHWRDLSASGMIELLTVTISRSRRMISFRSGSCLSKLERVKENILEVFQIRK